jgi:hypothetical protein
MQAHQVGARTQLPVEEIDSVNLDKTTTRHPGMQFVG